MNQPPQILLSAVSALLGRYDMEGNALDNTISDILQRKPRLQKKYQRPDPASDRLYRPECIHPNNPNTQLASLDTHLTGPKSQDCCAALCGNDPSKLVIRSERTKDNPVIHYGLIASANQLMKDAITRDKLADAMDVLCFEMEAGGLMNQFPCLVIRGICDYSDSHKNKEWQGYAAMAAAAYAKDLLSETPHRSVEEQRKIVEIPGILSSIDRNVNGIRTSVQAMGNDIENLLSKQRRAEIHNWLSPPDPSTNLNTALRERQENSGLWFLQSTDFIDWRTRRNSFLWLHGIPGCGKTVLSSIVIMHLKSVSSCQPLFFYFDSNDADKQSLEKMLRVLTNQLSHQSEEAFQKLDSLFSSCGNAARELTCQSLCKTFFSMAKQTGEVWLVLDALDECPRANRKELFSWIRDVATDSERRNIHLLVTSRLEADIESEVSKCAVSPCIVSINSDLIGKDINAYIKFRVGEDPEFQRWRSRPKEREKIETVLSDKASGMFRWAKCQLDVLKDCLDRPSLYEALESLPETLDDTYARILLNIPKRYRQKAIRILQFLTYSERPLTIEEAVDALAVNTNGPNYFDPEDRMPFPRDILHYCSSLVVVVASGSGDRYARRNSGPELQLAHFSVKEYLTSDRLVAADLSIAQDLSEIRAKASMTKVCLAYLLNLGCDADISGYLHLFPFIRYCAVYWASFAVITEEADETVQDFVRRFLCSGGCLYQTCYYLQFPIYMGQKISPLFYACKTGLKTTVEHLLSRGVEVNVTDKSGVESALSIASYGGYQEIVELLLRNGADVKRDNDPIIMASDAGHYDIVKLLLKNGADVNAKDTEWGHPLSMAAAEGHRDIVELLLKSGADINKNEALALASGTNNCGIVELLLSNGADVNSAKDPDLDRNILSVAAEYGQRDVVELLLTGGATDINKADALVKTSRGNHYDIVELLLNSGADVNASASVDESNDVWSSDSSTCDFNDDYDALSVALVPGYYNIVELLLDRGASITETRALQKASSKGHYNIVELLLKRDADANMDDGAPILAAASNGHWDIVELLLKSGADVNAGGNGPGGGSEPRGNDLLSIASSFGHHDTVELLLNRGANIKETRALQKASGKGHYNIVKLLLSSGVNADDGIALSLASNRGHCNIVELLLNSGADVNASGGWFDKALSAALNQGYHSLVELLFTSCKAYKDAL